MDLVAATHIIQEQQAQEELQPESNEAFIETILEENRAALHTIDEYETKIEDLQSKLQHLTEQFKLSEDRIQHYRSELVSHQQVYQYTEDQYKTISSEVINLEMTCDELRAKVTSYKQLSNVKLRLEKTRLNDCSSTPYSFMTYTMAKERREA